MATSTTWQSTDGDWSAAGSWSNGVPDEVIEPTVAIFDATSQVSVTGGLATASANRVLVKPEYDGDLGLSASPLTLTSATGSIVHRGTGTLFLKGLGGDFVDVVIDSPNLLNAAQIDGSIARLWVKQGKVTVLATCDLSKSLGVVGDFANVKVEKIDSTETETRTLIVTAGRCEHDRGLANNGVIVIAGGHLIQTQPLAVVAGIEDVVVQTGGLFEYRPKTAQSSDPIILMGAMADFSQSEHPIPITRPVILPGATVIGDVLTVNAPWSTLLDLREPYP